MPSHGSRSAGRNRASARAAQTLIDQFEVGSAKRRAKISGGLAAFAVALVAFPIAVLAMEWAQALFVAVALGAAAGVVAAVLTVVWPVLRVAWHWAGELVLLGLLIAVYALLAAWVGPFGSLAIVALLVGVPWFIPPANRWLNHWGWCMVTRHRLRVASDAFMEGKGARGAVKPLILIARPTQSGERVWLWLRGDLTLDDLQGRLTELASVCWANSADARPAGKKAAYAVVDIHRRDVLAEGVAVPVSSMLEGIDPDSYRDMAEVDEDDEGVDITDDPVIQAQLDELTGKSRRERKPRQSKADKAEDAAVVRREEGPDEDEGFIPAFI
ncbi:hypothetical protein [Glycomyces niveus]|uniref:Uncharacterized protein n=1 Tax=Glycomyces niveus TaxID=2820287 RepID=A0ABS3U9V7_9ACTN|nr:hypothetical protein [Glycomyces sp. NEAU-S30]MBO3735518.1 hypothetical protein [Glycomyces sp. NEAU-S30]